jgi:hypothetical protein
VILIPLPWIDAFNLVHTSTDQRTVDDIFAQFCIVLLGLDKGKPDALHIAKLPELLLSKAAVVQVGCRMGHESSPLEVSLQLIYVGVFWHI